VDYPPSKTKQIRKVFITNDLTEPVLKEAIHLKSDFIVSYHPTPFRSFKKVVNTDRTARIVLECVANGIAVYSPHTASDAAVGTWCSKKKRLECYENSDTNARTQAV
jgi:putative NIF3 family GTP cyclohydrolase 1 type 2